MDWWSRCYICYILLDPNKLLVIFPKGIIQKREKLSSLGTTKTTTLVNFKAPRHTSKQGLVMSGDLGLEKLANIEDLERSS